MRPVSGRVKANTVRDICSARKTEFRQTASVLRSQIDERIMEAASQGQGSVVIDVPRHYMGREPYDWVQMGKAIVAQILADGYYVSGTYIRFKLTWDHPIAKPKTIVAPLISIPSLKKRR